MIATQAGIDLESIDRQEEGASYRVEYDQSTIASSSAVVAALSAVQDVDPVEMVPLHRSVDPDALDDLLDVNSASRSAVSLTFATESHEVTIDVHGVIEIDPLGSTRVDTPTRREQLE